MKTSRTVVIAGALSLAALGLGPATPSVAEQGPPVAGTIVFGAETATGTQLDTVRPDGSRLQQITQVAGDAVNPDWSPDGRLITFEWDLADDAGAVVAVVHADGSGLHVPRTPDPGTFEGQPVFSADGQRIIFERFDGVADDSLFSVRLDGSDLRRVTSAPPDGHSDPNVSPDGRHLSFVRFDQGVEFHQALTVSDADGSHQRDLVPPSFDVGIKQAWSPDSKRLVFTRTADPDVTGLLHANLATIAADGTDLRMLTDFQDGRFSAFAGSYSPDGHWIVFRLADHRTGQSALFRVRPDGTHQQKIIGIDGATLRFIDWGGRP
jgi:Tol biopolymer transport system component